MNQAVPYLDLAAQMLPLRQEIEAAIGKTLNECAFCLGPQVEHFERDFAQFCGAAQAVGFNSGTSALHVAMRLHDIGPGDEVITTPFTFVATSWAIWYVGARPVYVDIDEASFCLDAALIERAVTPRTRAILPVHLFGHPCNLGPMLEICRRHNLELVEDAAQAHGAIYRGRKVGTYGVLGAFSFYPGKNLGAYGEGGALVTNDPGLAARARALRNHGSTESYLHEEVGYNYRMEGIQGAVLGVKLKRLAEWNRARRRIAQRYHELLADAPLQLPKEADYGQSVYHLYVVRTPHRAELKHHLDSQGIGCRVVYPVPLHLQKCFAALGYRPGDFPVAEKAGQEGLSLPIYPELTEAQIERVAEVVKQFFRG